MNKTWYMQINNLIKAKCSLFHQICFAFRYFSASKRALFRTKWMHTLPLLLNSFSVGSVGQCQPLVSNHQNMGTNLQCLWFHNHKISPQTGIREFPCPSSPCQVAALQQTLALKRVLDCGQWLVDCRAVIISERATKFPHSPSAKISRKILTKVKRCVNHYSRTTVKYVADISDNQAEPLFPRTQVR